MTSAAPPNASPPPRDPLVDADVARSRSRAAPKAPLEMPEDFAKALDAAPDASRIFEAFTPGDRPDCIGWIVEAKHDVTRASRVAQAVEWIAEGRTRRWKYRQQRSASSGNP